MILHPVDDVMPKQLPSLHHLLFKMHIYILPHSLAATAIYTRCKLTPIIFHGNTISMQSLEKSIVQNTATLSPN